MTVPASKSPAALTTPIVRPFIDDYENSMPRPVGQPLPTLTSRDKFALCVPELWPWGLDISYRMLQPAELKQAQGFPRDYAIAGTKTDQKKQIGNAVPVHLATALCKHVLTAEDPSLATYGGGITGSDDVDIPDYHEVVSDD
jgi:DNA (cytosine-5)-methyltransferase 1